MVTSEKTWRDIDLRGVAVEASYGLMLFQFEGSKKEHLQKISDGLELLDMLNTGEKIVQQDKATKLSEYDAYIAVKRLLEPRKPWSNSQMSEKELKSTLQRSSHIRSKMAALLEKPDDFPMDQVEECQTFFAELSLTL